MNATPFKVGIRYGLITSLLVVIASMIMYATGYANPSGGSEQFLITILLYGTGIYLGTDAFKKGNEGYASMKEIVKISFYIGLISGFIGGIFSYIYLKFIDPQIMQTMMREQRIQLEERGMSDEVINQTMQAMELVMSPGVLLPLQIIFSVITITILGLIMGAILKKERPAF